MRIRFAGVILGVLLIPAAAYADSHFADAAGGGSGGGGGSTLGGFVVSFGKTKTHVGKEDSYPALVLGGVGDVSVQFGKDEGRDVTQVVWTAGPRLTFKMHPESRDFLHAKVEFGGVYTNDGKQSQEPNDKALVAGAAWDYIFGPLHDGQPTMHPGLGMRLQADRVFNLGDRDDVWRLSAGVVYRFPNPPTP